MDRVYLRHFKLFLFSDVKNIAKQDSKNVGRKSTPWNNVKVTQKISVPSDTENIGIKNFLKTLYLKILWGFENGVGRTVDYFKLCNAISEVPMLFRETS